MRGWDAPAVAPNGASRGAGCRACSGARAALRARKRVGRRKQSGAPGERDSDRESPRAWRNRRWKPRSASCEIEAEAIAGLIERLDARFEAAVELLYACKGRVVVTGLGKSGLIGRKVAATFSSTGTPSFFLHAAEALHGDLGMLTGADVLLAISSSGETEELIELVEAVKRLGTPLVTLTAKPRSTLAAASDVVLDIAVKEEACSLNLAPTASTAAALAMGDALAIALLERRGFQPDDFAALHPGGRLGKKLRRVEALMHSGEDVAARAAGRENAGRDLRDEPQGSGPCGGDRSGRQAARNHHRRRPAARDAEAQGKCAGA